MIYGNAVGGLGLERTYILADPDGNEVPAVMVDKEIVFTAKANDIRLGTVAATEAGVTEGTKEIPPYYVLVGTKLVPTGSSFVITTHLYEYTQLQVLICGYNTSISKSVETEKVLINGSVYPVNSNEVLAEVTVDASQNQIKLGITNDGPAHCVMRYFGYKEEY